MENKATAVRVQDVLSKARLVMFPVGSEFMTPISKDRPITLTCLVVGNAVGDSTCGAAIVFHDSAGNSAVMMFKNMATFQGFVDMMQFNVSEYLLKGYP